MIKCCALVVVVSLASISLMGQEAGIADIQVIIDKIKQLENQKDAKCYATANRLEDFMYGTPLSDEARNTRIDIQKEIIHFIKQEGSKLAEKSGNDSIQQAQVKRVIESQVNFGKKDNGNYYVRLQGEDVVIKEKDFRQYSSVSYGYRAMLSVEQDMILLSPADMRPFASSAVEEVYSFVNLMTLATLQLADRQARANNKRYIDSGDLIDAWVSLLEHPDKPEIKQHTYPEVVPSRPNRDDENSNKVLAQIISQKLASYEAYNQLTAPVFLRNIQVFFARQRWPKEEEASNILKNYLLESLITFSSSLIAESQKVAVIEDHAVIRLSDVQKALERFTPFEANYFEDIVFFPNHGDRSITIESYDLDAFRDSGWHWLIMSYSVKDLLSGKYEDKLTIEVDPNAAELVAEGIAQMGVLVLRLAGKYSHDAGKQVLDVEDLTMAFLHIQELIHTYPTTRVEEAADANYEPAENSSYQKKYFTDESQRLSLPFVHKSSDWLSRTIRSYVVSEEEQAVRLAIPPAFGGSGVAATDINNDGYADILLLGGEGNALYINDGRGQFSLSPLSEKLSPWNASTLSYGEPRQPIVADFDNDGDKDIFISYVNEAHRLYRNEDGHDFTDVSDMSNLGGEGMVGGPATAFDFDNDGLLDICIGYFGNYLKGTLPTLSRNNQNGDPNRLFRNIGGLRFEEVPPGHFKGRNTGWTQAMGHTDLNGDGLQDLIVGNDFGINEYYINNGDGTFSDKANELGTDKPSYTMNVGITDLNRDGIPDLYISNIVVMQKDEKYVSPNELTEMKFDPEKMTTIRTLEANDLFMSNAGPEENRYELSQDIGRGYSSTGWSWDADFFDYDNDGDEDLYCLNGMNDFSVYSNENPTYYNTDEASGSVLYADSERERNVFFENENGYLVNRADSLNLAIYSNSRSAAYLDFDNDGDLDIIINNYHDKAQLLENKLEESYNWVKVKLSGDPAQKVNMDAIGAQLILDSENHKGQWREIHSTDGYLSVHPTVQHFGLGEDETGRLTIIWPNGTRAIIESVQAGHNYEVRYPDKVVMD